MHDNTPSSSASTNPFRTLTRRNFVRLGGLATAGIVLSRWMQAAPLDEKITIEKLIQADKKLPSDWVHSLYAKGSPTTTTDEKALLHIGMPVGGLFCGTVYLGGDGKLWLWDVFNDDRLGIMPKRVPYKNNPTDEVRYLNAEGGAEYVRPENAQPSIFQKNFPSNTADKVNISPDATQLRQGFALRIGDTIRTLDRKGWKKVAFTGSYPVGTVDYSDPATPISVRLEAFSPFIPLNTEDSSLPVTLMRYTLKNASASAVETCIGGWMDNAVFSNNATSHPTAVRRNIPSITPIPLVQGTAVLLKDSGDTPQRTDILYDDFSSGTYAKWEVTGEAFGTKPLTKAELPSYMQDAQFPGKFAAISHRPSNENSSAGDAFTGKLTSQPFKIERHYINLLIAGGKHPGKTCVNLLVDGKVVRSVTGHNSNVFRKESLDARNFTGKTARLEVVDDATGSWGNISVAQVEFSDSSKKDSIPFEKQADYGSFCLALAEGTDAEPLPEIPAGGDIAAALFSAKSNIASPETPFTQRGAVFGLRKNITVPANSSVVVTFAVAWHFPNTVLIGEWSRRPTIDANLGRHYANRFKDAAEVAAYVVKNLATLSAETFLWRDTWYDSTLPHWFLDRTFSNTSTLATTVCHQFANGRFYAWEGVGSCEGTCTHVWQYAQAPSRLFPDIERDTRDRVDLGIGFNEKTGIIGFRAEHDRRPAVDGQCGRIVEFWREHCMSTDDSFLKTIWPRAKRAIQYILDHDTDGDGILEGGQHNTLDAAWYGKISWLSIQALGAWRAGELMAGHVGDVEFAKVCRGKRLAGQKSIESELFNGNWFIQLKDPANPNKIGTYNASYIDQLWGQSLAYQTGLGELISKEKELKALSSIWRYNFAFDLTKFIRHSRPYGRPYAVDGEGGTVMSSNALNEETPYGEKAWTAIYFNECMSGFEHQLASHMMRVGMVEESLAITRAIHDRYAAEKRNPYNEVECSDHYARAMASYGTFLSACGYDYNGPAGKLAFAPQEKLDANDFKAAFTTAEGWGTFSQKKTGGNLDATLAVKYGRLVLREITLAGIGTSTAVSLGNKSITASAKNIGDGKTVIALADPVEIKAGQTLQIKIN